MALQEIEYGSIASSQILNDNFDYLDDQITDLATSIGTVQSNMASINSTLNSSINSVSSDVTALAAVTNPTITSLASSGTIALSDNSINKITPSGTVTFTLPTVTNNSVFHQILVQVNMTSVQTINVGTSHYFNSKAPDMTSTGKYDLIYEYDSNGGFWVCGWMGKS